MARLSMDLARSKPARIQHVFWPNERLRFYLNGKSQDATIEDGLLPAGREHLEIRYEYWPLRFVPVILFVVRHDNSHSSDRSSSTNDEDEKRACAACTIIE